MDYLALQNAVLDERFDATAYRDRVKGWLNDGARLIVRRSDISALRTLGDLATVADADTIALPADFARGVKLFYADRERRPLEEVLDTEIDDMHEESGEPRYYAITGGELYVWPTPDAVYDLKFRYQRLPALMVDSDDEPELPDEYHDLIVTYATSRGYRGEDDKQAADGWMADFEADLARMKTDLRDPSLDGPIVVPGTFDAGSSSQIVWLR